jgi:hypothetical protein
MTNPDICRQRLINQQIAKGVPRQPADIVSYLLAMQAQEYAQSKWSISLRVPGLSEPDVEKAFNEGSILRTHLMRPTWHFVCPADIRWMLKLTAPRVHAVNAFMYRKTELDGAVFKRSNRVLVKALQGGNFLSRDELRSELEKAKITASGIRLAYLLMYAELEGVICSGPRKGKQFTYALMDERVGPPAKFYRQQALAEIADRYFRSRGPATLQDFVWWSGLAVKDAREAVEMLKPEFIRERTGNREYIFIPLSGVPKGKIQSTFLMSDYDEYGISYKDRSAIFSSNVPNAGAGRSTLYSHMLVVDGIIEGTWRQTLVNKKPVVETSLFKPLAKTKEKAVQEAIRKYTKFMNV